MKNYIGIVSISLLILVVAAKVILAFQGPTAPPGIGSGVIAVDASNNVGIGISAPKDKLHVIGGNGPLAVGYPPLSFSDFTLENNGTSAITLLSPNANVNALWFADPEDLRQAGIRYNHSLGQLDLITGGNNSRLTILDSGNVGVGTASPTSKLDVSGTITSSQIKLTGGVPGAGKILTSDAVGLATWQNPVSGGNGWIRDDLLGQVLLEFNDYQVGVGAAPTTGQKLRVSGGTLTVSDEIIGTKLTDWNGSAFYVDPASTGLSARIAGSVRAADFVDEQNNAYYVDPAANLDAKVSANLLSNIVTAGGLIAGKLMGQSRSGVVLFNAAGECVVSGLKISRSIPSVRWEGAAAACPANWWVCSAAERGSGSCGAGIVAQIQRCRAGYYDGASETSTRTHGRYSGVNVDQAWVSNATNISGVIWGQYINTAGVSMSSVESTDCDFYPVWCCTDQ